MASIEQAYLVLNSTFFVAFEMTHNALKSGLKMASDLNTTQYRTLVKLSSASSHGVAQADISELLDMKANVVTQVINTLEAAGFAERKRIPGSDGRLRVVHITRKGILHVTRVNDSIVKQLYALFPTQDAAYRNILEASIAAGAHLDPPLSGGTTTRYAASRALISLELLKRAMEGALRTTCKATYNECRILQRLGEVDEPLRIGDVAHQLQMTPVAVARAVDALAEHSWVTRLASPLDRKAVFVKTTDQGVRQQKVIARTIALLARNHLWNRLEKEQQHALAQTWRVVIADVQAREEAERKAALSLLQPIERT